MSYWQDKIVLVTGASSGFGLVLAEHFAAAGSHVVLVARSANTIFDLAAAWNEQGRAATAIPADVTDASGVAALFKQVDEKFGRLDLLANIAGKSARGEVKNTTVEQFRESIELNFLAAVACTNAALPMLLESRGHVVQMGSLASKGASRFIGPYPASKFPLAAYSQQLRLELGPEGLHTLLVCPGPISRDDPTPRGYAGIDALPPDAAKPGGGVKVSGIDPHLLAEKILRACEQRKPELVIPWKARILFALSQLSPTLGDWLTRKMSA